MAINFPNSPSVNDTYSFGGKNWFYDGNAWLLINITSNVALSTSFIEEGTNLYFTNARATAVVEQASPSIPHPFLLGGL